MTTPTFFLDSNDVVEIKYEFVDEHLRGIYEEWATLLKERESYLINKSAGEGLEPWEMSNVLLGDSFRQLLIEKLAWLGGVVITPRYIIKKG